MAWKCKEPFLWFKTEQVVDKIEPNWRPYFEEVVQVIEAEPEPVAKPVPVSVPEKGKSEPKSKPATVKKGYSKKK